MTITEKLELIRAGYTKAEIEALASEQAEAVPAPAEPSEPAEPNPAPAEPAGTTDLTAVLNAIEKLTQSVIKQNIIQTASSSGASESQSVDDILASIINPIKK